MKNNEIDLKSNESQKYSVLYEKLLFFPGVRCFDHFIVFRPLYIANKEVLSLYFF